MSADRDLNRDPGPAGPTGPWSGPTPPAYTTTLTEQWPDQAAAPSPVASRRRWRLALAAAVAVAVAGTGVALAARTDPQPTPPQAGPVGGSPAPTAAPTSAPQATPSGSEGLGGRPSAGSSASAPGRPFPGSRRTLAGASIGQQGGETFAQALNRTDRTLGEPQVARVFYPGLPPAWPRSRADVVDRTVVVSFKAAPQEVNAGRHDARLASWFSSVPRDYDVYWSYFHEPEDDVERGAFAAADYKAAWRRIAELADRADNPKLVNTVILMCWTLDPKSGRNFTAFYPGGDLVEALGWDCYNFGHKSKRYASPDEVYGRMIAKSRELGKPFGVAETGSSLVPGDSGAGRAAWIHSATSYLNGKGPKFVAYYNQVVSQGDFRLLDAPSIQAWRSFCRAPG